MQQFGFKKHIPSDIDTNDQLHSINCSGRHVDYNWMTHHLWHILMWDARKNFIFREVHPVIYEEEYIDWYLTITHRIITPIPTQVSLCEEMEYKPHACQIQNVISIYYFL